MNYVSRLRRVICSARPRLFSSSYEMCSLVGMTFWEPLRRCIIRGRVDEQYSWDYPHYVTENYTVHTRVHSLLRSWIMPSDRLSRYEKPGQEPGFARGPARGHRFSGQSTKLISRHVSNATLSHAVFYRCPCTVVVQRAVRPFPPSTYAKPRRRPRKTGREIGSTND